MPNQIFIWFNDLSGFNLHNHPNIRVLYSRNVLYREWDKAHSFECF